VLDDYLEQLTEEGDFDSDGQFTLDPEQARKKLASSRFMRCAEGILAVLSASLMADCTMLRVQQGHNSWVIESDALPPGGAKMKSLLENVFNEEQVPWLREMGLAFNSLYPKHCIWLRWETQDGEMACFQDGEWVHQSGQGPIPWQRITIQQHSLWKRPWQWLQQRWLGVNEEKILKSRTRWSPVPVGFPDQSLGPPAAPPEALALFYVESRVAGLGLPDYAQAPDVFCQQRLTHARSSLRGALLAPKEDHKDNVSQILLVYRGITMAQHRMSLQGFCFDGVLNSDSFDLDASRQRVVQNPRLRQRTQAVRDWVYQGIAAWLEQVPLEDSNVQLKLILRRALMQMNQSKTLRKALGRQRILPLADGESWISLDDLAQSLERFGALYYMMGGGPANLLERPLLAEEPSKRLLRLLGQPRVVDASPWVKSSQAVFPSEKVFAFATHTLGCAEVVLPLTFGPFDEMTILLGGQPLVRENQPLFEGIPTCFRITVSAPLDEPLEKAAAHYRKEIRDKIRQHVQGWIEEMLEVAISGALMRLHSQHFCSLMLIWRQFHRKPYPQAWWGYPEVVATPEGDRVMRLDDPALREYLGISHPISLL